MTRCEQEQASSKPVQQRSRQRNLRQHIPECSREPGGILGAYGVTSHPNSRVGTPCRRWCSDIASKRRSVTKRARWFRSTRRERGPPSSCAGTTRRIAAQTNATTCRGGVAASQIATAGGAGLGPCVPAPAPPSEGGCLCVLACRPVSHIAAASQLVLRRTAPVAAAAALGPSRGVLCRSSLCDGAAGAEGIGHARGAGSLAPTCAHGGRSAAAFPESAKAALPRQARASLGKELRTRSRECVQRASLPRCCCCSGCCC